MELPPEAWNVIFKSGNAWAILLGLAVWRHHDVIGRMKERMVRLETLLKVKGLDDGEV